MATEFKTLQTVLLPTSKKQKPTEDFSYWKTLQFPITIQNPGAVTHIEFSNVHPYNYLVTSSTKVQIYSSRTNMPLKSFHRFSEIAHSASFRADEQLIVVGSDDTSVRIIHERHFEHVFKGHTGPVHLTKFLDNFSVYSGSDDKSVRIWDIATRSQLTEYNEHGDYVRSGSNSSNPNIFVTGSYDGKAKIFDNRTAVSMMTIDHNEPIESVLMYPSGGLFASAGGNVIKVWDIVAGGRLLTSINHHHKTVTYLTFCSNGQRLVSASLDRHVKFYELSEYRVVHSLDYPSAILSVGLARDDSLIAIGSVDNMLTVRERKREKSIETDMEEKKEKFRRSISGKKRFEISKDGYSRDKAVKYDEENNNVFVEHKSKDYLKPFDVFFKKFKYSKALDAALNFMQRNKNPEITLAVFRELRRREGLKAALAGRSDKSIETILMFFLKNFVPPYINIVLDLTNLIVDLYKDKLEDMPRTFSVLKRFQVASKERSDFVTEGLQIVGALNSILTVVQSNL